MPNQALMMLHATLGVLGVLASLWVFVEALNLSEANRGRLVVAALSVAVLFWVTYLVGGYWYVVHYGTEKAIILAGPWPAAHKFFMETKEHVFLLLLLLASFLPIAAVREQTSIGSPARPLLLWSSGLLVLGGLAMEGAGALISLGVKLGLAPQLGA